MLKEISSEQFHAAGVPDWRVVGDGARARFHTGSFATGIALVAAIGRIADAADHHPEVDVRGEHVTVRLWTAQVAGLSSDDVHLARRISRAAHDLGANAEPGTVQSLQITIDTMSIAAIMPFWRAVLGYNALSEDDVIDPYGHGPWIHFQQMDQPRRQRNCIHLDLYVPQECAKARVAAAVQAGGRVVNDDNAPLYWTLADPDGNEVDVAPWPDLR